MNRFILWTLLLLSTAACTIYKDYPIEIYEPGKIAFPPNTENVAIVYRNFKYDNDTLLHYFKDDFRLKKAKNDPQELDSILANLCISELAKNLKDKDAFEEIKIFPELFKLHTGDKLPELNMEMIEQLAIKTNTDLVISLETYSSFYSEYPRTAEVPSKSNEVITAAVWAVYNPFAQQLIERKTMIDTIFWNGYDTEGRYNRNAKLPPRITALKIAAQMVGENYSKRFFASWQNVNRTYSVPPLPDFAAADAFVQKGEWDNAIMLWKRYAEDKNGKIAINARYNLALAFEMKDDFDAAKKWLQAAHQIATDYNSREDLKMILRYQQLLAKRKRDIERLTTP